LSSKIKLASFLPRGLPATFSQFQEISANFRKF
jgi:hypothetical protein